MLHNATVNTGSDQGEIWIFGRRVVTFKNEHKKSSSLLSVGSLDEGPDSPSVVPKAFTCPPFSAVIDFTVGSFSLLECRIFGVPNSVQVPLKGGRARTSSDW